MKNVGNTCAGFSSCFRKLPKKASRELQCNDVLLSHHESFLDLAGVSALIIDVAGNIIWANKMIGHLTHYTVAELSKTKISQILTTEALNELRIDSCGRSPDGNNKDKQHLELELIRKDGSGLVTDLVFSPLNDNGHVIGIQMIFRDVTELRRTEESLRRSNEFNFNLMEESPYPVLVKDNDGNIIRVNSAFQQLSGYSESEVIGLKAPYPWWTDQTLERQAMSVEAALSRSGKKFEEKFKKKNREIFWVEVAPKAVVIDGKLVNQLTIWADITDRKKRQKDLEHYLSRVIKAQEDERKYVASELHDGVIQDLSALALDIGSLVSSQDNTTKNQILDDLTQFKDRVSTIISEMRRFCHELRPYILDRMGLVSALHVLASEIPENTKLQISVQTIGISERFSPMMEVVLFRVTQEAINNILKHSGATSASIVVKYSPSEVKLTVSDNGCGFDCKKVMDTLPRSGKLGLLGMRNRVRLVGGKFCLFSERGRGTKLSATVQRKKTKSCSLSRM